MRRPLGIAVLGTLALAGCTPQQIYDSTRALRVDQCQQLPLPEQEECMRRTHESFEEYERRREEELERGDPRGTFR